MRAFLAALLLCVCAAPALARDLGQWDNEPADVCAWYGQATLTKAAQAWLGFVGCCDDADVVKAQFRFERTNGNPAWFYLKDGAWTRIPYDIIHWDESAPDNKPALFALAYPVDGAPAGTLTCFYPPSGGY